MQRGRPTKRARHGAASIPLTAETGGSPGDKPGRTSGKGKFRPDVEGLRAVAVGAVLLYHAGLPFAGGGYVGVDVFFVISGYLITGLLLREIEGTGRISLSRFYSRRAKRLLPLTVVVLAAVVALSWPLFSPVRMDAVSWDVIAAALYVINWRLGVEAVDYFEAGLGASPVQHFWSLSIEEQFYLLWPALLLLVAWWCRRTGRGLRPALAAALGTVAASSFVYGVYLTEQQAGAAYFATPARAWELALGGMLALVPAARLRVLRPGAAALAAAGLCAIAWSTYRFGDETPFPGYAALLPTLGTAAVIAAGTATTSTWPGRLLTLSPMRHVGRISYSWYLWHWPPLVFAAAYWGDLSPLAGMAVVAASYIPAVLSHRWVESPFLRSGTLNRFPRRALALGGACTAISVALGLLLFAATPTVPEAPEREVAGAEAAQDRDRPQKDVEAIRPEPRKAYDDRSRMHADGCLVERLETRSPECVYGDPNSDTTVVLFGDSHAMQHFPALEALARERGWRLVGLTKGACPPAEVLTHERSLGREYRECVEWRERTLERIAREKPDMIVTSSLATYRVIKNGEPLDRRESAKELEKGYASTLDKLRRTGAKVVVVRDVPHPDRDVPDCVSRFPDRLDECALARGKALGYHPLNVRAAEAFSDVELLDLTPVLCGEKKCPAVIGDVLVYRNGAHITATFSRTLAPWFGKHLQEPARS